MSKYKNALQLVKDYIKTPYPLLNNYKYSVYSHEHICFPFRLLGSDFKYVCPHYCSEYFDCPEHSDCCDTCKYLGIIDFNMDEKNKKNISFVMDKSIVEVFKDHE